MSVRSIRLAMRRIFLFVLVLVAMAVHVTAAEYKTIASGVQYTRIGDYDVPRLNRILTTEAANFSAFKVQYPPAENAVRLYRVRYSTVIPELGNRPTTASGLVAVPLTAQKKLPVVSYQHGTVFTKTAVPSRPEESDETRIVVARLAGHEGQVVAIQRGSGCLCGQTVGKFFHGLALARKG